MYTRNFLEGKDGVKLPDNYDGVAFSEPEERENEEYEATSAPPDTPKKEEESESVFASLAKLPVIGGLFGGGKHGGPGSLKLPRIGTEEILIIGAALFLLFSKDGDKECGIILLLLLLVN